MKFKALVLHFCVIFVFFSSNAQIENELTFQEGEKKIVIELENDEKTFKLNRKSMFTIYIENIELKTTSVIGKGIKIIRANEADKWIECTVTVDEKAVFDDKYKVIFGYFINNERIYKTFLIPVTRE